MKKQIFTLLAVSLMTSSMVVGCSKTNENSINLPANNEAQAETDEKTSESDENQNESKPKKTEATKTEKMSMEELESKIAEQPLAVISTNYLVQSQDYKAVYPDMLQFIIKNNSEYEIKDAVVALTAWDENNLPVLIEGQFDFEGKAYIKEVNCTGINLIKDGTFGDGVGFCLGESCDNINKFKAVVVSFETFDGEKWENPYYEDFCDLYEGKKLG